MFPFKWELPSKSKSAHFILIFLHLYMHISILWEFEFECEFEGSSLFSFVPNFVSYLATSVFLNIVKKYGRQDACVPQDFDQSGHLEEHYPFRLYASNFIMFLKLRIFSICVSCVLPGETVPLLFSLRKYKIIKKETGVFCSFGLSMWFLPIFTVSGADCGTSLPKSECSTRWIKRHTQAVHFLLSLFHFVFTGPYNCSPFLSETRKFLNY